MISTKWKKGQKCIFEIFRLLTSHWYTYKDSVQNRKIRLWIFVPSYKKKDSHFDKIQIQINFIQPFRKCKIIIHAKYLHPTCHHNNVITFHVRYTSNKNNLDLHIHVYICGMVRSLLLLVTIIMFWETFLSCVKFLFYIPIIIVMKANPGGKLALYEGSICNHEAES